MDATPYYSEVAGGPADFRARWLRARDGVRLRAVGWPTGEAGTVLMFSGRTEYVEKYARAAGEFAERGFSSSCIDWRGQGLSDRALTDALTGHVADFLDYQHDVAALHDYAVSLDLPRPFHLVAHSMGGAIGLRALHRGLNVAAAAFSAPMWGIGMSPMARPFAWSLSWIGRALGHGDRYTPGTSAASYVAETTFESNHLTTSREMFDYMQRQTREHPDLTLGGPSLSWLFAALREARALRALPPTAHPTLAFVGTEEAIIDPEAIRAVMGKWRTGRLEMFNGARHEIMMEREEFRTRFFDEVSEHFMRSARAQAA